MSIECPIEVSFSDPDLAPVVTMLGELPNKLQTIATREAEREFGKTAISNPSNLELSIGVSINMEPALICKSWHEVADSSARFQTNGFSADIRTEGEDGILEVGGESHILTTREFVLLIHLTQIAFAKMMNDT